MYKSDIVEKWKMGIRERIAWQVTMLSDTKLIVEGHRGVMKYLDDEILLRLSKKYILIKGEHLHINEINDVDIMIDGSVRSVEYIDEI